MEQEPEGIQDNVFEMKSFKSSMESITVDAKKTTSSIARSVGLYKSVFNAEAKAMSTMASRIKTVNGYYRSSFDSQLKSLRTMTSYINSINNVISSISANYYNSFEPAIASLTKYLNEIEWKQIAEGSRKWGEFGWVPHDGMIFSDIKNPPENLNKADKMALHLFTKNNYDKLCCQLIEDIKRKADIKEALALFNEHRYKPAAMMVCSLIEYELLHRQDYRKNRKPINTIKKFEAEMPVAGIELITTPALIKSYDYFFRSGNNFDRDIEGELNRNFLQHGMMYKPVRKKTCTKLLLLLQAVAFQNRN